MVTLYRTPRTYFDHICTEYGKYPIRNKLLDIGYATWHGHDIMEDIRYILDNYPYISEDDIRFSIHSMLAELNHCKSINYYISRHKRSLETEVKTLINDLMKVYRLTSDNPRKDYLADNSSIIYFSELKLMNGWVDALRKDRQPYKMFSDGHWIMFPGDSEIICNFNLNLGTENSGYISYVYPEPWYGNPTSAKIIILGNDVHYDDKISRIQNLVLSKMPSLCEAIQLTVDSWMELEGGAFYDLGYIGYKDERLRTHDLYNSPTYYFWLKKIYEFADYLFLPQKKVFDNIAVINANPYTSLNVKPLEPGLLPSHYFLRQLVRYVVNNDPKVLFILPCEQLRPIWKEVLGDVYDDITVNSRLLSTGFNNSISLRGNWNIDQIDQILKLFAD